jgi:hypothetical protein
MYLLLICLPLLSFLLACGFGRFFGIRGTPILTTFCVACTSALSLVAFYEGSWITVREKRRGVVSSKYYLAFQFDERTNFRIIDNSEKNGSDIELTAKFLKNGIQQNKTSKYTFFIEDSIAAEELISNFKALQKLQSAQ